MRADQCPKCKLFKVNYQPVGDTLFCRNCGQVFSRRPTGEACPWFGGNGCPELDIAVCQLCIMAEFLIAFKHQTADDWPQLAGKKSKSAL